MPVLHEDLLEVWHCWVVLCNERYVRFVCSPLVFGGVLVSCFQIALLGGSFEQGSRDNLFPIGVRVI